MNKIEKAKIKKWLRQLNQWEIPEEFIPAVSRHEHPYSDGRDHIRVMFDFLGVFEKALSLPTSRVLDGAKSAPKNRSISGKRSAASRRQ